MAQSSELMDLTVRFERGGLSTAEYQAVLKALYPTAEPQNQVLIRRTLQKLNEKQQPVTAA